MLRDDTVMWSLPACGFEALTQPCLLAGLLPAPAVFRGS